MSVRFWLTDQDADVQPTAGAYKRAALESRGDNPSLVRAVTATEAGPTSGVQVTRTAGGTTLAWLTDPLANPDPELTTVALTAAAWEVHAWAMESDGAANCALRLTVERWTNAAQSTVLNDTASTVELNTAARDYDRETAVATATTLDAGDRLLFTLYVDDATGSMAAGHTVMLSYGGTYPGAEGDSYLTCPDALATTARVPARTADAVRRALHQNQERATDPESLVTDGQMADAVRQALQRYSHDRPRLVADYLSGDGASWSFPLPRRWVAGFSDVRSIEYPAGQQSPTLLDRDDWAVVELSLGGQPVRALHFPEIVPEAGTDNILVRYTTRHEHGDSLDTVPPTDFDAFCWLAAMYLALTLAARGAAYRQTSTQQPIPPRDEETRWRSVATSLRTLYEAHLGIGGNQPAAGGSVDWDTNLTWGADRLFHRRRWR